MSFNSEDVQAWVKIVFFILFGLLGTSFVRKEEATERYEKVVTAVSIFIIIAMFFMGITETRWPTGFEYLAISAMGVLTPIAFYAFPKGK